MTKKEYKATIYYHIDELHPDYKYIANPKQELKFEDVYKFPIDYSTDYCIEIIKEDLKLIAGGGYNYKHIHHIKFEITEVLQNEKN